MIVRFHGIEHDKGSIKKERQVIVTTIIIMNNGSDKKSNVQIQRKYICKHYHAYKGESFHQQKVFVFDENQPLSII